MEVEKYEKGGSAGSKGVDFQVGIITVFLFNALRKLTAWKLSTENEQAGKFDDVVLEAPEGAVLLQAKHKEGKKRITLDDLMSTNSKNDDFSMGKYFLSYVEIKSKFQVNSAIVCTNADIHEKALKFLVKQRISCDNVMYHEDDSFVFYTVKEEFLPTLKEKAMQYYESNYKKKKFDVAAINDVNLQEFMQHFQFVANYPAGENIEKVSEKLLTVLKLSSNIYQQVSILEINFKIIDWFQQKNGVYLTEALSKVMFSEIRRDKRWHVLEEYGVHFHDTLNFTDTKQIFHFPADAGYLLQELKVYRTLKNCKTTTLYANFNDETDDKELVIKAFQIPKYTFLLIITSMVKVLEESLVKEIINTLRNLLTKCSYKKVVLVAKNDNELIQEIVSSDISFAALKESVQFEDLSNDTQERLVKLKNIVYQGNEVSLEELLTAQTKHVKEIVNSDILESLVLKKRITLGSEVLPLDEDTSRFYVKRLLTKSIDVDETESRKETFTEESIFDIDEKVILIADSTGMGKSTILVKLAHDIKQKNPHLWVIRIELIEYTPILRDLKKKKKTMIDIYDLLNSNDSLKVSSEFEKGVFSLKNKVVLMLDGVDEVSPDYTELIINLIINCRNADNFEKIFVTTRPYLTQELQEKLQVNRFVLEPFTEECQVDFLTSYWLYSLNLNITYKQKCQSYAKILLNKMRSWVNTKNQNNFSGIPLQIKMLAEVFQANNSLNSAHYWEGCKEHLENNNNEPILPEKMDVKSLYEMFIEKKRYIFMDRENPRGYIAAEEALNAQFDECMIAYRKFAVEEVLSEENGKHFSCFQEVKSSKSMMLKIGIVQKSNNTFSFIHRTFAEYFVAECLLMEMQTENRNLEFLVFLVNEILGRNDFNIIRAFLSNFLEEAVSSIPSNIFQAYHHYVYNQNKRFYYMRPLAVLAEEGYVIILKLLFNHYIENKGINSNPVKDQKQEYFSLDKIMNIKDLKGRSLIQIAILNNQLEMVKFLVSHGASIKQQFYYSNTTPLSPPRRLTNFSIKKIHVTPGVNTKSRDGYFGATLLGTILTGNRSIAAYLLDTLLQKEGVAMSDMMIPYTFSYLGDLKKLQCLIEIGVNANGTIEENGESLIFGAARGEQLEVIKYLIERGADINKQDGSGGTVLHMTSTRYSLIDIAQSLLELGINPNIQNRQGKTALHKAVECENVDLIKVLVNFDVDVNIQDGKGKTALLSAQLMKQKETAELLEKYSGNVCK